MRAKYTPLARIAINPPIRPATALQAKVTPNASQKESPEVLEHQGRDVGPQAEEQRLPQRQQANAAQQQVDGEGEATKNQCFRCQAQVEDIAQGQCHACEQQCTGEESMASQVAAERGCSSLTLDSALPRGQSLMKMQGCSFQALPSFPNKPCGRHISTRTMMPNSSGSLHTGEMYKLEMDAPA